MEFKPVVFVISGQEYGVDISYVSGIEKPQPILSVPNAEKNIKGIINLRGEVVPVYSLHHRFGLPESLHTEQTRFIIVNTDNFIMALEADKVEEIKDVAEDRVFELPKIVKSEDTKYVDRVINDRGHLVLVLSVENLLTSEEAQNIRKLVDNMSSAK